MRARNHPAGDGAPAADATKHAKGGKGESNWPENPAVHLPHFRRSLLKWYAKNRRPLPWRQSRDPYRIWVAEIMLQQTRIAAVIPYYERFLARFPEIHHLAEAEETEVLRFWSGLGYYQRARNLHRAAKRITDSYGGNFPLDVRAARTLPGVGSYTLAAVLSIAAGERLAAMDGNTARVMARVTAAQGPLRAPENWKTLQEQAQRLVPRKNPGDWNQALMELGETICTPRSPQCIRCPIARFCRAHNLGMGDRIPAGRRLRDSVRVTLAVAVLCDTHGRTVLMNQPGQHDAVLFSRLRQFPAIEVRESDGRGEKSCGLELNRYLHKGLGLGNLTAKNFHPLPMLRHTVTFRDVRLMPFLVGISRLPKVRGSLRLPLEETPNLAISSATRKIARAALKAAAELSGQ